VIDDRLKCHCCGQLHKNAQLVKLHDGREVGNYSEEWRIECEANFVVRMPTLKQRRSYIDAVREKRGNTAAIELQQRIASIWKLVKDAQPTVANNIGSTVSDTPTMAQGGQPGKTGNFSFTF
jgi:hypothetical protein